MNHYHIKTEMAVLSVCRNVSSAAKRFNLLKNMIRDHRVVPVRNSGGHGHAMEITPSQYQWRKFKDYINFYILLGVIPLTIITVLINMFIGPAELAEIPEGYNPHIWEYYKHPVSRFFARNFVRDPRLNHEMTMCIVNEESEKIILRRMERIVKEVMKRNNDYRSWYYRPVYGMYHREFIHKFKELRDNRFGQYEDVATEYYGGIFSNYGDPNPPK